MPNKDKLIKAMDVAGYTYDELESTDDWLRFFYDGGVMTMGGWQDVEDWLNGVVFDDPDVDAKVYNIMDEEV